MALEEDVCDIPIQLVIKTLMKPLYFECVINVDVKDKNDITIARTMFPPNYIFLGEENGFQLTLNASYPLQLPDPNLNIIYFTVTLQTFERVPQNLQAVDSNFIRLSSKS